jgi:hypothetical protein
MVKRYYVREKIEALVGAVYGLEKMENLQTLSDLLVPLMGLTCCLAVKTFT